MNQSLYKFGIFLLALSMACGLFETYFYFQLGTHLNYLQPFATWFLVVNIIFQLGTLVLLKYLHFRHFRFAFLSGLIAAFANLGHFMLIYSRLILVVRKLDFYIACSLLFTLVTGIVFAAALVFSKSGRRPWLRMAGFVIIGTNLVLLTALIQSNLFRDLQMFNTIEKISQWVLLASSLVPGLFMLNFIKELASGAEGEKLPASRKEALEGLFGLAGMVALILILFLGSQVAAAGFGVLTWKEKGPIEAQKLARTFEARSFVGSQGDTLKYLFQKPLNYDPAKKYPLVVCLHGGPAREPRPMELTEPAPLLSKEENREKYPAFLFVPQGPPGILWGGVPNIPAIDSLVFETIQALEAEFAIDEKRRYVAGISGGGYGSWYFISTRPEMFAAAMPICGEGNPELAKKVVGIPVWAFHGDVDRNVPVRGSRDMIEAIRKAGGNPRYTEFAGVGHNVWPEVSKTPGLLDWLFAQKRD